MAFASPSRKSMLGTQSNSRLPSSPAYGFGTEERSRVGGSKQFVSKDMTSEKLCTQSPGPVYYPASSTYKNTFASPSHSFGASHRYMLSAQKQATAAVPGPGMYQTSGAVGTQRDSSKHSYSSWGFGTSTRADMAKVFVSPQHAKTESGFIDSPGPAAYSFGGTFGRQSDSRRSSSQSFGMGTSDRFFHDKKGKAAEGRAANPGPGAYQLGPSTGKQSDSMKPTYPINSFTKADRDRTANSVYLGPRQQQVFWGRNSPGPALYATPGAVGSQVSSMRRSAPRAGFGTADRFAYMDNALKACATPGPGSYSV